MGRGDDDAHGVVVPAGGEDPLERLLPALERNRNGALFRSFHRESSRAADGCGG
jgi:hypothetical protein